jgi:fatty-acyl-CoA synthase
MAERRSVMPDISLGAWFAARVARSADRRALTFEGKTLTYGQLLDRVDRLAAGFRGQGLCHGDRIGFLGTNQPALLETFLAASRIGAIFVPMNFRLTGAELSFIVGDAGLHTLVADGARQAVIDGVRGQLPVHRYVGAEGAGAGWQPFESVVDGNDRLSRPDSVEPDEVAVLMYTSGTTGHPKGVMLTHANLWWNNINQINLTDIHADDVTLVSTPLFHIAGLNVFIPVTWQRGGEVVLHRTFDAQATLDDISRYRISTLFAAVPMLRAISELPDFESADLSSVRMIIGGGGVVPEALIKLYQARGISLLNGYGLTETAPSASFLTAEYALTKRESIGRAPLLSEVKVVDGTGVTITEPHVQGEICARGPNVMKGYWNLPEATAEAIDAEGWFHTGDVGYFDSDGFLYIVDRLKDMVNTGGENVSSVEVENVIYAHPSVADVAIIGLHHEHWGETVVAVAVLRPGQMLTLEELREFAGQSLARYELPTRLLIVDELPRNLAGKVLKRQLRDEYRAAAADK